MTLLSDTAYHSFIGEVEALNTTTIRRLTRSRRHQLLAIARVQEAVIEFGDDDKKAETLRQLDEIEHKLAMKGKVSKLRLDTIEKIMATSTPIATSDVAEIKAAER